MEKRYALQSAMEYLLTYGWAMLIIAIVLVIIFQLHIFEPNASFTCLGQPGFLCSMPSLSSGGALTVNLSYNGYSYPITIIGLVCNVTSQASIKSNSIETTSITVNPGQQKQLVFQCPIGNTKIGSTDTVFLSIYYSTPTASNLQQNFAKGVLAVQYTGIVWNVTEWIASSSSPNAITAVPFDNLVANPISPSATTPVNTLQWSSFDYGNINGWAYSTDYHNHDVYNGIETVLFPAHPLSDDTAGNNPPTNTLHGYTAITYLNMSGPYTFSIWTDDGTEIFYKPLPGGSWSYVFPSNSGTPHHTCVNLVGNPWNEQAPCFFTNTINLQPGKYEVVVDYIDTSDPAGLSVMMISPQPTQST